MDYSVSFLTNSRIFGKPVKLTQWGGFGFDLLFILFLWMSWQGFIDLHGFATGASPISVPASTFVFFGALAIYGIRIAMYIAMLRRNRAPQVAEWLVTIIPIVLAIPCFAVSGHLVKFDARLHGYRFCYSDTDRSPRYVFAASGAKCPALPPDGAP